MEEVCLSVNFRLDIDDSIAMPNGEGPEMGCQINQGPSFDCMRKEQALMFVGNAIGITQFESKCTILSMAVPEFLCPWHDAANCSKRSSYGRQPSQ